MVPPKHSLQEAAGGGTTSLGGGTTRLGGGTAQCSVSVRLTMAVVPPNTDGGTVQTQETPDEIFLGSKFEST